MTVVPVGVLLIAMASLIVARRSGATARSALGLNQEQDERRKAGLAVRLVSAVCLRSRSERRYLFDIVVRNPSDRPNSIPEAELWIDYSLAGRPVVVRVPWRRDSDTATATPAQGAAIAGAPSHSGGKLTLPISLATNDSTVGLLCVVVPVQLVGSSEIQRVRLMLFDTFGRSVEVNCEIVQDRVVGED